jgi:hypothetical protein
MVLVPALPLPKAYATLQRASPGVISDSVQSLDVKLHVPVPDLENVTCPVGVVVPDEAVSVTIAAHPPGWPTTTGLSQETVVVVVF